MVAICHIVRQFYPGVGGLESFVEHLALEQMREGHDCEVLTLDRLFRRPNERLTPLEYLRGLCIRRVPMWGMPRFFTPLLSSDMLRRFDVLHVHGIDGMFDRIALEPRKTDQVAVATTHGGFFHTRWMRAAKQIYFHTVTRATARSYDAVIATSSADRAMMAELGCRAILIPNGVAPLLCTAQGRDLLSHGRLASHKRLDLLIKTMAEPALEGAKLHIVGPEWDISRQALTEFAHASGVSERVHIHGAVSVDALQDIATRCGVFVSASAYEGFGMALIEGFSAGLSAVVAPNPSFSEIMTKAPVGRVADFVDPKSAALAIRAELGALTPGRRAAAQAFAQTYSWKSNTARTLEVYGVARHAQRRKAA